MDKSFEGQVALVTGGSSGIGAAVALELARAGAKVVVTGRHEAALRASAARHPGLIYVVADVARADDVARSLEEVKTRFGRLDALINNAGILEIVPLADAAPDHVRRTWETNVAGLIETTRAALPLLRKSKGSIVNLTTVIADQPFANMSVYCASKAAVLGLMRGLAVEWARDGILVNSVAPGWFPSEMTQTVMDAARRKKILARMPLHRFGRPDELAAAVLFLLSPAATYITGHDLAVDGGALAYGF